MRHPGVFRFDDLSADTVNTGLNTGDANSCILELECFAVKITFESRPRSSGMTFGISMGELFLRDTMTPGSPALIAPFQKLQSVGQWQKFTTNHYIIVRFGQLETVSSLRKRTFSPSCIFYLRYRFVGKIHQVFRLQDRSYQFSMPSSAADLSSLAITRRSSSPTVITDHSEYTLFELTYDKRPLQSRADYRSVCSFDGYQYNMAFFIFCVFIFRKSLFFGITDTWLYQIISGWQSAVSRLISFTTRRP